MNSSASWEQVCMGVAGQAVWGAVLVTQCPEAMQNGLNLCKGPAPAAVHSGSASMQCASARGAPHLQPLLSWLHVCVRGLTVHVDLTKVEEGGGGGHQSVRWC
jgi:hypothetical protein